MAKIPTINQVFVPYAQWEAVSAGLFALASGSLAERQRKCLQFGCWFADLDRFERTARRVFEEWPMWSAAFMTNANLNRVAWLGSAAVCLDVGLSAAYRSGFYSISDERQKSANQLAADEIARWIHARREAENRAVRRGVGTQMLFGWYPG